MRTIPIGKALKAIREQRNMSQNDVEVGTGMTRSYTSRVENGCVTPSLETLALFAVAYGTQVWKIIKLAEEAV